MATVLSEIEAQDHNHRIKTAINPGEGAFYGTEVRIRAARPPSAADWQCGTTQVDFNLPERFGAFYIDADGSKKVPVMVHRAICGSMERFIGILIEHYAGNFPLWLAPIQAVVTTITSEGDEYAKSLSRLRHGARVFASNSTCATRRSTTRFGKHSLAENPGAFSWSARRKPKRIRCRSGASEATHKKVMPTDEAIAAPGR